jgi:hypothetical protein
VAIDDDPLIVKARQMEDDQSEVLAMGRSMAATVVNLTFPGHVGEFFTEMLGVISQKRWNERGVELLTDFASAVASLKDQIADEHYYKSEEFQALVFEAMDQGRTNRHQEKRKMLSIALARSGTERFLPDPNKELYLRCLRDLTPLDILQFSSMLDASIMPVSNGAHTFVTVSDIRENDALDSTYRRLEGLGLLKGVEILDRHLAPSPFYSGMDSNIGDALIERTTRSSGFRPTNFGIAFMQFVKNPSDSRN